MADLVEYLHKELNIRIEQPREGAKIENQLCIWHCEESGRSSRCMRSNKPKIDHATLRDAVEEINHRSDRFRMQGGCPSRDEFSMIVKPMKSIVKAFSCGLHRRDDYDKEYRAKHLALDFFTLGERDTQQESQAKKRKTDEAEEDEATVSSSASSASILPRPTKRGRQTPKPSDGSSDMATHTLSSSPPTMPSSHCGLKETNTQTTNTTEDNMHLYRDTAANDNLNLQFQDNTANHDQETVYPGAEGFGFFCGSCYGGINTGHTADCEGFGFFCGSCYGDTKSGHTAECEGRTAARIAALSFSVCDECALGPGHDGDVEWSGTCFKCGKIKEMIPIADGPVYHSASAGDNVVETESGPVAPSKDVMEASGV